MGPTPSSTSCALADAWSFGARPDALRTRGLRWRRCPRGRECTPRVALRRLHAVVSRPLGTTGSAVRPRPHDARPVPGAPAGTAPSSLASAPRSMLPQRLAPPASPASSTGSAGPEARPSSSCERATRGPFNSSRWQASFGERSTEAPPTRARSCLVSSCRSAPGRAKPSSAKSPRRPFGRQHTGARSPRRRARRAC